MHGIYQCNMHFSVYHAQMTLLHYVIFTKFIVLYGLTKVLPIVIVCRDQVGVTKRNVRARAWFESAAKSRNHALPNSAFPVVIRIVVLLHCNA